MITDQFHPLDEVTLFGHTIHGLVRRDKTPQADAVVVVDGVEFPVPANYRFGLGNGAVLQIVRHPGAGPVALPPETLASERAAGRVWQNYALLDYGRALFGSPLNGWIHIDSLGQRWLIRPGQLFDAFPNRPYQLTLDCRPFGYLNGAPMDAVSIDVTCADIEQGGGNQPVSVSMTTINSTGSRCLLHLSRGGYCSGFLEISISDAAGVLAASLTVLRSLEDVRGTWHTTEPDAPNLAVLFESRALCPVVTLTGDVVGGPLTPWFPEGGGTVTLSVTGYEERDDVPYGAGWGYARYTRGSVTVTSGRTGRLIDLVFDDADELVEITFDTEYRYNGDMPGWQGTASGSMTNSGDNESINARPWTVSVTPQLSATRTISERYEQTLTLLRNGVAQVSITSSRHYNAVHSATLPVPDADDLPWFAGVGLEGGADWLGVAWGPWDPGHDHETRVYFPIALEPGASVRSDPLYAELGGPWGETTSTPITTNGRGDPALTTFPLGTIERDADRLDMTFESASYQVSGGGNTGVSLLEVRTSPVLRRREIALLFAHAAVMERGDDHGLSVAYNPVDHTVVESDDPGITVFFV